MDVVMPQLGETVAEGKIAQWFKQPGDRIQPGDNLFEIETDKVTMEVPAISGGTLAAINVQAGEVAKVGVVVAVITDAGEKTVTARAPDTSSSVPALDSTTAKLALDPWNEVRTPERNFGPARRHDGVVLTPLARRLAAQRNIDIATLTGTGPRGRVLARDVTEAPGEKSATSLVSRTPMALAGYDPNSYEAVPVDTMRATIARRLVDSKQTIPHFYLTTDVAIGKLLALRSELNGAPDDRSNMRLSLNDFVIKAWAAALMRVPAANAIWADDRILKFRHADLGVAVAIDGGLITPVVRNADAKTLTAISGEMKDLAERARARKLKPTEYIGGASAISNLGMFGVREFAAIVNPPQSSILAVGAGRRAPRESEQAGFEFHDVLTVTLSCDHRVIDGALGATVLAAFKLLLENPVSAIV